MSKPAIEVHNVSKKFQLRSNRPRSVKTILVNALKGKLDFGTPQEFFTLRDVSFSVKQGEFIGIMGRNGAGKSTLLKLISGIYTPSSGSIQICGPVAPLIELGAGFDGELSGYENIFLNGAILGYGRRMAQEALPAIMEFAELGDKIHMPIKHYSSGMLVRLGFSIATHLPAPVLLMDEVLSVGDVGFQQKCLSKIESLHKEGRTIVLITHDPAAVEAYCSRCLVLENQEKIYDGEVSEGVRIYRELFA